MADNAECSISECTSPTVGRGWCRKHYHRWRTHGDPLTLLRREPGECSVPECEAPSKSRGWCGKHYHRWARHGDPLTLLYDYEKKECSVPECARLAKSRGWCGKHYGRWIAHGDPLTTLNKGPNREECSVSGCTRVQHCRGLCERHYTRIRKTGSYEAVFGSTKEVGTIRVIAKGYVQIKVPGHPTAYKPTGWALLHRKLMWDAFGEGPHPCWGCGKSLEWSSSGDYQSSYSSALVVNHLNEDTSDNTLKNLTFSCNQCNRQYSLMLRLMEKFDTHSAPQLNKGQLAVLACDMLPFYQAEAKLRQGSRNDLRSAGVTGGDARDMAGKHFGVSGRFVYQAGRLPPDLREAVKRGKLTLTQATKKAKERNE